MKDLTALYDLIEKDAQLAKERISQFLFENLTNDELLSLQLLICLGECSLRQEKYSEASNAFLSAHVHLLRLLETQKYPEQNDEILSEYVINFCNLSKTFKYLDEKIKKEHFPKLQSALLNLCQFPVEFFKERGLNVYMYNSLAWIKKTPDFEKGHLPVILKKALELNAQFDDQQDLQQDRLALHLELISHHLSDKYLNVAEATFELNKMKQQPNSLSSPQFHYFQGKLHYFKENYKDSFSSLYNAINGYQQKGNDEDLPVLIMAVIVSRLVHVNQTSTNVNQTPVFWAFLRRKLTVELATYNHQGLRKYISDVFEHALPHTPAFTEFKEELLDSLKNIELLPHEPLKFQHTALAAEPQNTSQEKQEECSPQLGHNPNSHFAAKKRPLEQVIGFNKATQTDVKASKLFV